MDSSYFLLEHGKDPFKSSLNGHHFLCFSQYVIFQCNGTLFAKSSKSMLLFFSKCNRVSVSAFREPIFLCIYK